MRKCEYCSGERLSYQPPIHGDYGTYFCLDCGKHSDPVKLFIIDCFEELKHEQRLGINWVFIRDLYQLIKKDLENLTIKDFHKALLEMNEQRKVEFSCGSIARPHVSKYGIHTKNGVYAYVKVFAKKVGDEN